MECSLIDIPNNAVQIYTQAIEQTYKHTDTHTLADVNIHIGNARLTDLYTCDVCLHYMKQIPPNENKTRTRSTRAHTTHAR